MRTSRRNMALAITLYAAACGADGWPPISAELLDLDGRIEYGFYASDAPIIEGALERLKQMPDSDEIVRYYKAFGAYRLAQLRVISQGTEVGALLDSCATETQALGNRPVVAAEAWILSAACAELAARRAPAQSGAPLRKFEQAVTRARELDASNPRLALIESRALSARRAGDAGDREAARARLEAAIAEFEARSSSSGAPQWGEAEALALLAEIYLEQGERRLARDKVEEALLAAPGYHFALALREKVSSIP